MFEKILFATNILPSCDAAAKIAFELAEKYASELILSRPCKTCFWYFNQIVFGTDFSKAAMSAFHFAYKMAHHIGCKLHLFHALNIEISQAGVAPGQKFIEAQIKEAKAKMERLYVSQVENFDNYKISVWEGVPHVELLKFTREISGDLIVMAHHTS
jgi:nucleotide-binding universal stress UspA family protein